MGWESWQIVHELNTKSGERMEKVRKPEKILYLIMKNWWIMILFDETVQNGTLKVHLRGKEYFFNHVNADIFVRHQSGDKYNCIFKCRYQKVFLICESSAIRIYKSSWENDLRGWRGERKEEEKEQDGVLQNQKYYVEKGNEPMKKRKQEKYFQQS